MPRSADDFLSDIAANPDDDELKAVFADWLVERGDPRGEFMASQLKRERSDEDLSREALLSRTHMRQWLPDEVLINLVPSSIVFEKGVFAGARVSVRSASALTASLPHPVWSTVRALANAPLELTARCRVLEELTEVDELALVGLARAAAPALPRLRTLGVTGTPMGLARALEAPIFHRLRELRLGFALDSLDSGGDTREALVDYQPSRLKWLLHAPIAGRLERLVLHTGWVDLGSWLTELDMIDTPIGELQLTPMAFDPTGWWLRLSHGRRRVRIWPGSDLNVSFNESPVREILATVPARWFERVTLPDEVGWQSVRKLRCFEGAAAGRWDEG